MMPAFVRVGMTALGAAWGGLAGAAEEARQGEVPLWPEVREQTFNAVWQTVNDSYFDATFGGVDWAAVGEKYRRHLPEADDKEALRHLLRAMLGELRKTHFSILPREMSVFTPAERSRAGTVGLAVVCVGHEIAVEDVVPGSPAAEAGIGPGDVILAVDGLELAGLRPWLEKLDATPARRDLYLTGLVSSHLQGSVGSSVRLQLRPAHDAERSVELKFTDHAGEWTEPMGSLPSVPIHVIGRCEPDGLAYLRFNVFARPVMKDFRALVRQVPADGGMVIDLRGNSGGLTVMASGLSGWLSDHSFSLGAMHLREGHMGFTVTPQSGAFLGPVAVLIDSGSASTSEILAAGLQEAGRARIFGETSPGAALPSLFKALPTGDLLQHAIADLQTPHGQLIEGGGVKPDEVVARSLDDLAAGRDPVLEAARRWIESTRHKPAVPPADSR
ncbi:MAG TPA: S41 family peptidase [Lacunisphaera sp.]|nr:S41 family peptidase [Lacunisphaera sp.]